MSTVLQVVDAFTDRPFTGNPAAVCLLSAPRSAEWMQLVAREMNLSETAFLHPVDAGYSLRWFTPSTEVRLCGHATLAAAHVLWESGALAPGRTACFSTQSGPLTCRRADGWIEMDFPALHPEAAEPPPALEEGLPGAVPVRAALAPLNWLVELQDEQAVLDVRPDFQRLAALPVQGVAVTARSGSPEFDFVSRFFAPACGVDEDPVTGSAHCALGPYWQSRLGKADFTARQASRRGGVVKVGVRGPRVLLGGQAVTMSRVELSGEAGAEAGYPHH